MLKKEYEILNILAQAPWKKFTFREVMELSKKKSKGYVYATLESLVKENVATREKAGNVVLYSLNCGSGKARAYAGFCAEYAGWNKKHIPCGDLEKIISIIPTDFFIFLITGSYASGAQKKGSDIDVVIMCDECFEPKEIYSELRHACEMNIPPIHLYVFKNTEFMNMLLDKKANYGKEIAKNSLILSGGAAYYKIMSEALKNGFNG